jgi:hypothetical protein
LVFHFLGCFILIASQRRRMAMCISLCTVLPSGWTQNYTSVFRELFEATTNTVLLI